MLESQCWNRSAGIAADESQREFAGAKVMIAMVLADQRVYGVDLGHHLPGYVSNPQKERLNPRFGLLSGRELSFAKDSRTSAIGGTIIAVRRLQLFFQSKMTNAASQTPTRRRFF